MAAAALIPTIVIGGWLGAGKTTLVNHLLRQAGGRRLAVLVNDFGDLVIDADLIDRNAAAGEVVALAGGCICCSFGADLLSGLNRVLQRDPAPDGVLIEASGVGLPAAIARTARLAPALAVEGIVVIADALTLRQRACDPYIGDTVRQQLREADLLLLNKTDLVDAAELLALEHWLDEAGVNGASGTRSATGAVARANAVQAQVPPELVLGLRESERAFEARARPAPLTPKLGKFHSASRQFTGRVDVSALSASLAAPGSGVLRAKGVLTGLDGRRIVLQGVGRRIDLRDLQPGEPAPAGDRLLLIGLGDLDRLWPAGPC